MGTPTTVYQANQSARVSEMNAEGGRATLERGDLVQGGNIIRSMVIRIPPDQINVPVLASSSAGAKLPARHEVRDFVGFGTTPVATAGQFSGLASDAARDNAVLLSDTDAPIGSTYRGLTFNPSTGAVTGAAMWLKTAANTWTQL